MSSKRPKKKKHQRVARQTSVPDIELYYRRLFKKFGADPRADGYSDELARTERFKMYCRHFDFSGKSVLDVGCGMGMLLPYLVSHGVAPSRYVGVDIIPEKISAADKRMPAWISDNFDEDIDIEFVAGDVTKITDLFQIVIACSIFDVKQRDVSTTFKIACRTMEQMWGRCTEGIGVDFFSPYALDIQPFNAPIPPEWVFTWAMQNLNQRVMLDYTYLPHDYSIIAYRDDNKFVREWKRSGGWKRETGGEHD